MSSVDPIRPGALGLEAAEYVLGVLDAGQRTTFTQRLAVDPGLRAEVAAWEGRLGPMADEVTPVSAPVSVWPAIVVALGEPATAAGAAAAPVTPGSVVALRRKLNVWRFTSVVSLALAAALAVVVFLPAAPPPPVRAPAPVMIATLAAAPGAGPAAEGALFVATFDPGRSELTVAPATVGAHPGRAPEMWLIPAGGKPAPLGMAAFERPVRISLPIGLGGQGRTTLAVSLEPPGGSPTGQPTGPVIATGELKTL